MRQVVPLPPRSHPSSLQSILSSLFAFWQVNSVVVLCGTLEGRKTCRSSISSAPAVSHPLERKGWIAIFAEEELWLLLGLLWCGVMQIDRRWYGVGAIGKVT